MVPLARDLPRRDHYRFTATLVFARTEDGGRRGPVGSDYRVPCWFGLRTDDGNRLYNDCLFYFRDGGDTYEGPLDRLWVSPGGSCTADALVVYPEYVQPVAAVGARFVLWEGRDVAAGEIIEIFDPNREPLDPGSNS